MPKIDQQAAGFFIAGALVGGAIAILYAPKSGAGTKKDIRRFAENAVDRLDDLQSNLRNQVTTWVDEMTEIVKDGVDRGTKLGTEGYEQVLQGFDNAKKCVEEGKSRLEQLIKNA